MVGTKARVKEEHHQLKRLNYNQDHTGTDPECGDLLTPISPPEDLYQHLTIMAEGEKPMMNYLEGNPPEETGICAFLLTSISVLLIIFTFPFSLFLCVKVVQEYERAVIFRLGRLLRGGAKGPGIFFIVPCIDTYCKVDLRTVSFDVPPQEILSKDSVTVAVDAVVYYRISNATIAVSNVEDYGHSTRLLAATTLRNVLGTKSLSEILIERETISHVMQVNY
ncbi:mechanosensory protein 2-like isoform X2 [Centruroides sculpturatus]|uniref:mechanosensory protein 2-like isoform X2 n=1 Tax=Centruroides sculpturatus TaxID=218467 RepID=UPI000C6D3215|nr:mechanosensory protein 2-like isoform X2 [Centruroides sculpturatus]